MGLALFFSEYVVWHYGKAFSDILNVSKNILRFGYHFFSIRLLARTWISPWYRLQENLDPNWKHVDEIGIMIFGNVFLRLVGCILRTFIIVLGVTFEVLVFICSIALLIIWVLFPLVILFLLFGAARAFL